MIFRGAHVTINHVHFPRENGKIFAERGKVMRILVLSDLESEYLWDHFEKEKLEGIDLILSCGDLKSEYLSFLATFSRVPVLYVKGNHDAHYEEKPPGGCDCIENQIVEYKGIRILGLGGSYRYRPDEPNMYTEREMQKRLRKLRFALHRTGGVDILLTHSPARGLGDQDDLAHRGFQCFVDFMDRYKPAFLVHGHVHANYTYKFVREREYQDTRVINAYERYIITIPDAKKSTSDRLIWRTRRREKNDDPGEILG